MASMVFKRGNRMFASGSIGLIITSILHTLGHFAPPPVDDPALTAVSEGMQGYRIDMGMGMHPSLMDVLQSLSLTMTVTVLFLGICNLMTLSLAGNHVRLVRRLTLLNVLAVGALVTVYAIYRIPPPLICFIVVEIIFILALILPQPQETNP